MTIHATNTKNSTNLLITGATFDPKDAKRLQETLMALKVIGSLEITLSEALFLPDFILIVFAQFLEKREIALKFVVFDSHLHLYLLSLGFSCSFIPQKSEAGWSDVPKALCLGGSAESLDKIIAIIEQLPLAETSIFIVQHLQEGAQNFLPTILQTKTPYKVVTPEDKEMVKKQTVYIASSGYHMRIVDGVIYLGCDAKVNYARPSIDVLFHSIANEYKDKAVIAILCGYGNDGVESLDIAMKMNSMVFVEDPKDCNEAKVLTRAAQKKGNFHFCLSIEKLANQLAKLLTTDPSTQQTQEFLSKINTQYGYDFRGYVVESVQRRIKNAMARSHIASFGIFENATLQKRQIFDILFSDLSVKVTSFFRDSDSLKSVVTTVFPYLDTFSHIRILCAGCSTGEEAYTLAILLEEAGLLHKTQLYAIDMNEESINVAKNGLYPINSLNKSVQNYLDAGGKKKLEDYFEINSLFIKVKPLIKEKILFFQHTLVGSGVLNEFQLIFCRNVMIYFDEPLKVKTLELFYNSLDSNGYLVLGESENIMPSGAIKLFNKRTKTIFQKGSNV